MKFNRQFAGSLLILLMLSGGVSVLQGIISWRASEEVMRVEWELPEVQLAEGGVVNGPAGGIDVSDFEQIECHLETPSKLVVASRGARVVCVIRGTFEELRLLERLIEAQLALELPRSFHLTVGRSTANLSHWSVALILFPSICVALWSLMRMRRFGIEPATVSGLRAALLVPAPALAALLTASILGTTLIGPANPGYGAPEMAPMVTPFFVVWLLWTAVWEELLFRGWFYRAASGHAPFWILAYTGSVVFGVAHLGSPQAAAAAGVALPTLVVLSLSLFLVRRATGSVMVCCAAHMLNNAIALGLILRLT